MDPRLAFWTAAFVVMATAVALAIAGRLLARRGRVAAHRRAMHASALLIGVFLVAYVLKVVVVGREDLSRWTAAELTLLRLHETFVLVMLVAGGAARWAARRFRLAAAAPGARPPAAAHRSLGRVALVGALLGLLTGGMILAVLAGHAREAAAGAELAAAVAPGR